MGAFVERRAPKGNSVLFHFFSLLRASRSVLVAHASGITKAPVVQVALLSSYCCNGFSSANEGPKLRLFVFKMVFRSKIEILIRVTGFPVPCNFCKTILLDMGACV